MGRTIVHVGPAGAGQTVKCCNQLMVGMHIQAVCEALALGRADPVRARQAVTPPTRPKAAVSPVVTIAAVGDVALGHAGSDHYAGLETFPNPGVTRVEMRSDELVAVCEQLVAITQYGSTRSLNAGAAAAIAMYHWALRWAAH